MVRGLDPKEPYWRRVLEYCANGCLQAVVDEYSHYLCESMGLREEPRLSALDKVTDAFRSAMRRLWWTRFS